MVKDQQTRSFRMRLASFFTHQLLSRPFLHQRTAQLGLFRSILLPAFPQMRLSTIFRILFSYLSFMFVLLWILSAFSQLARLLESISFDYLFNTFQLGLLIPIHSRVTRNGDRHNPVNCEIQR